MALSHSPKIVTDGLVLCLDAGNVKSYSGSGSIWTDPISKTQATFNTPYYSSSNGGYFSITPTNSSSATYPVTNLPVFTDFSITVWAKSRTTTSGNRPVWIGMVNGAFNFRFGYLEIASGNKVYLRTGDVVYLGDAFTNDVWQMHTVTKTGSTVTFYINGSAITSTIGSAPTLNQGINSIGNFAAGIYTTDADIAIIKFYSKALNGIEVLQNFNALRGRYGL